MGASVEVLTLGPAQESRYLADGLEVGPRFNVQMLRLRAGRGPAYFRKFDRRAGKAAKARKLGKSYRISKSALEDFLKS